MNAHRRGPFPLGSTLGLLALGLALGCTADSRHRIRVPDPPPTRAEPVVDTLHGVAVEDPYRWLEDQESSSTREWIGDQNGYTDSVLSQVAGRQELEELAARLLQIDATGIPIERGGRYFFPRKAADQDLAVLYVREGLRGRDEVLVDPHGMSADHSVNVSLMGLSNDGRLAAYGVRQGGVDEVEIRVRDVDGRRDLPDEMPADKYIGIDFTPDGTGYYYAMYGTDSPRVWLHRIGTPRSRDREVFGEGYGAMHFLAPSVSDDGRWLMVHVLMGTSGPTEIHLKDLSQDGPFQEVIRDGESRSFASVAGEKLVITTNLDAPNQRVMIADLDAPSVEHWRELVPEREDAILEGASPAGGRLWVTHLVDVHQVSTLYDLEGRKLRELELDALGTVAGASGRWDSTEGFFQFSSFHIPPTIYRYDLESDRREVWARIDVPLDIEDMTVDQVHFRSRDGTTVPMFLVHRRDIALDGQNPTLLTGYGGFNLSLTPSFSGLGAAWVQRGGVFAVANLRGGGEFGEEWHEAGMLANKQNVFDDFIAAAEYLVANDYTRPEHLAVMGGSNGGLLVGAILTQRPELLGAVVCTYPLLDMVRYHKFMVAQYWVPEYGSSEDPEQFETLLAYSPYHKVADGGRYPATLFITGDGDTRVAPLHARKMAARLQAGNASEDPILLRYHIKAGHSGGQTVRQQIDEMVDMMSFLEWQVGR